MTMQTEAQSYFDGVDLVTGSGERRDGELCVMSLAALLAGEQHSDLPSTACPVITAFVIRINDAIDKPARQDLKDYATRIMGTDDGRHHDRAWLLTHECVNDFLRPYDGIKRGKRRCDCGVAPDAAERRYFMLFQSFVVRSSDGRSAFWSGSRPSEGHALSAARHARGKVRVWWRVPLPC
jgi:hypothetical protein